MSRIDLYRMATARAQSQRAALMASAADAKARIAPARLKSDVKEKLVTTISDVGQSVADTARARPVAATAVALGLVAWFARRPIAALFGRLFVRFRHPDNDADMMETDNG